MAQVQAGDFYLTSTALPYEMRWQAREGDTFEVSICISPIRCLSPPHGEGGHHDRTEALATGIDDRTPEIIPELQMIHWGNSCR